MCLLVVRVRDEFGFYQAMLDISSFSSRSWCRGWPCWLLQGLEPCGGGGGQFFVRHGQCVFVFAVEGSSL